MLWISARTFTKLQVVSLALASLQGCVTTQAGIGAFNNPMKAFADVLDRTGGDFRTLVKDGKLEEAQAFFVTNEEHFKKKKADNKGQAFEGGAPLAKYVYDHEYSTPVEAALVKLSAISSIGASDNWVDQQRSLTAGVQLVKNAGNDKVLEYFGEFPGKERVEALSQEVNRVIAVAQRDRKVAFESTFDSVLARGLPQKGIPYVYEYFGAKDYAASAGFQDRVLQKIAHLSDETAMQAELVRVGPAASEITKKKVADELITPRVRSRVLADGRIDLNELQELGSLKKSTPGINVDQFVRIGVVDLTSATVKNRGSFDFQVEFAQDLAFKAADAKDALLQSADLSGYDFVFLTDLSIAKISREFKSKKDIESKVQTGTRQEQNSAYVSAMTKYQGAMSEMQSISMQNAVSSGQPCYGGGIACAISGALKGVSEGLAKKRAQEAGAELARTSQFIEVPVYSGYKFQEVDILTKKIARVDYYLIDVKSKKVYSNYLELNNNEKFTVNYNVKDEDPDKSRILSSNQKEDDVVAWEKRPLTIKLSQLFDAKAIQSSSVSPYQSVQAFLKPISSRVYANTSPSYASRGDSAPRNSGSSSQTVADERFDSVVVVRTPKGLGTGFYVTPDLILTAYHVVDGNSLVELSMYDGGKNYGKVVDYDVRLDLALVKAQSPGKPVKIFTGPLKLGETVEAIGHPKGYEFTITRGVVSAIRKIRGTNLNSTAQVEFVQTDTPISAGNSGGPLFLGTSVIGVNDWIRIDKGSQNLNFSVSYNEIKDYLEKFKANKP